MKSIPVYQIDAFTSAVFAGNPAAVCLLEDKWLADDVMQNIAAENNLSETAFVYRDGKHYQIRWFTPSYEVPLCGHGTIAAAYVIFSVFEKSAETITLNSKSGQLSVSKSQQNYTLDFPLTPYHQTQLTDEIQMAFSIKPSEIYKTHNRYLLVFDTQHDIEQLHFNLELLKKYDMPRFCVTAPSDNAEFDFVTRYFVPLEKRYEDPVTGSNLCFLAPYWSTRLQQQSFHVAQLSQRGGIIDCRLTEDRVYISGEAVLYLHGEIQI
jgi:PhzF family phenazine biosynthesis protein